MIIFFFFKPTHFYFIPKSVILNSVDKQLPLPFFPQKTVSRLCAQTYSAVLFICLAAQYICQRALAATERRMFIVMAEAKAAEV